MANKLTSALTAITAFTFSDIIALVQGGNSRKGTILQLQSWLDEQISRALVRPAVAAHGKLRVLSSMVTVTPNGASVTATGLIPARSICLGVTAYVISTLTGTMTSFSVGYTGQTSAFGSGVGITAGSTNVGVGTPFAAAAATDVIVTLAGGTGSTNTNKIRLVAYYLSLDTPTG